MPNDAVYSDKEEQVRAFMAAGFSKKDFKSNSTAGSVFAILGSFGKDRGSWLSPESAKKFLRQPLISKITRSLGKTCTVAKQEIQVDWKYAHCPTPQVLSLSYIGSIIPSLF